MYCPCEAEARAVLIDEAVTVPPETVLQALVVH